MKTFYSLVTIFIFFISLRVHATENADLIRDKHFRLLCQSSISFLDMKSPLMIGNRNVDLKYLESILKQTKIEWTNESLSVNGAAVDAVNIPSNKVVIINRNGWDKLDQITKSQLCLHELWGVAFNDQQDDRYFYSTQMINILRLSILKSSMNLAECIPIENANLPSISINISNEFFMVLASSVIDEVPVGELSGYSQWIVKSGKTSNRSSAFVTLNNNEVLVHRFQGTKSKSFEELYISLDDSQLAINRIYSEQGTIVEEQKYQCGVII